MNTWKSFEEIESWQLAREISKELYIISKRDGFRTNYRLKDQVEGASGSIMDNIAEGFERSGNKEFINFLGFSKGSAGELRSQIHRIYDREYINEEEYKDLLSKIKEISSKINRLMAYLKSSEIKGFKFK